MKSLEQAKEHWKLEFQLLEMKYQKARAELGGDTKDSEGDSSESNPYVARIEEAVAERLMADSAAATHRLECLSLRKRARAAERRKLRAEEELKSALELSDALKEEIRTTATSYDGQLSMMSEHVANMNDKLR